MKFFPVSAALLAAALTLAVTASPALPIPAPPVGSGVAASAVFDAYLAIARSAAGNPAAARQAMPDYEAAVTHFNAGDFAGAQTSALNVIKETAAAPLPQPSLYPLLIPQQAFYPIANPTGIDQAYATGNVAVAHQAMKQCEAPGASPPPAVMQQFASAANALVALDYNAANTVSAALITACGSATLAYAAQLAALPQPSSTPIAMESYSPLPVATLIPDPALQQTKP